MNPRLTAAVATLALLGCFAVAEISHPARALGSTRCAPSWHIVVGPSVPDGGLNAVSAPAPDDAWAVGEAPSKFPATNLPRHTLIEHWDGATWTVMAGAATAGRFEDVAALDAGNVWVVGSTANETPIIEHWDGTQWNHTAEPWSLSPTAITTSASGEAWLAGYNDMSAMILHWNGVRWLRVMRRQKAELDDITAFSAKDIWAVGNDNEQKLLALHWNGSRWKAYPMGAGAGHDLPVGLYSVAATSANDVWAVGSAHVAGLNGYDADPVIRHWNGSRWTEVVPTGGEATLVAVTATNGSGPWVSGNDTFPFATSGGANGSFLAVHSGSTWKYTPTPQRTINGLAADPSGTLWAVGWLGSGNDINDGFPIHTTPLVERYTC